MQKKQEIKGDTVKTATGQVKSGKGTAHPKGHIIRIVRSKSNTGTKEFYVEQEEGYFYGRKGSKDLNIKELSFHELAPIIDFFEYKQNDLATFLDVDPSTVSRWKKKDSEIGTLQSKNIFDIDEIIAKGIRIFGTKENFKEWLNTTNYSLGDKKPVELLKNPYGVEMVEEAIDALSWGSYL